MYGKYLEKEFEYYRKAAIAYYNKKYIKYFICNLLGKYYAYKVDKDFMSR
jgi:hypothetical protein